MRGLSLLLIAVALLVDPVRKLFLQGGQAPLATWHVLALALGLAGLGVRRCGLLGSRHAAADPLALAVLALGVLAAASAVVTPGSSFLIAINAFSAFLPAALFGAVLGRSPHMWAIWHRALVTIAVLMAMSVLASLLTASPVLHPVALDYGAHSFTRGEIDLASGLAATAERASRLMFPGLVVVLVLLLQGRRRLRYTLLLLVIAAAFIAAGRRFPIVLAAATGLFFLVKTRATSPWKLVVGPVMVLVAAALASLTTVLPRLDFLADAYSEVPNRLRLIVSMPLPSLLGEGPGTASADLTESVEGGISWLAYDLGLPGLCLGALALGAGAVLAVTGVRQSRYEKDPLPVAMSVTFAVLLVWFLKAWVTMRDPSALLLLYMSGGFCFTYVRASTRLQPLIVVRPPVGVPVSPAEGRPAAAPS